MHVKVTASQRCDIFATVYTMQVVQVLRSNNKAIVDYTSPTLCTPVTSRPSYHQRAGGGPSHRHRQHAQKIW